jgi:ribonuclease P protein subunit POP4
MSSKPAIQALLARAHSPASVQRIFSEKIEYKQIHLGHSSPPPHSNAREARRKARKDAKAKKKLKPKPLSARERRRLSLYDIPKEGRKYDIFEPLNKLWLGYIRELLDNDIYTGGPNAAVKLSNAEFHGAEIEVTRSRCVSRVGLRGIVVKDSKFVFEIVTRRNETKIIPKEGTLFRVAIPVEAPEACSEQQAECFAFEVYGDQVLQRAPERANKKFKSHFLKNI